MGKATLVEKPNSSPSQVFESGAFWVTSSACGDLSVPAVAAGQLVTNWLSLIPTKNVAKRL